MTKEQKKKIEEMWLSGKCSVNEIADSIGENKWEVYNYCASLSYKRSTPSRKEKADQENRQQVLGPVVDYLRYHIPADADMMVDLRKVVEVIEQYIENGKIKE